jgi:hypothetical protein
MVRKLEIIYLDTNDDDDDIYGEDEDDDEVFFFEHAKSKKRALAAVMRAKDDRNETFIAGGGGIQVDSEIAKDENDDDQGDEDLRHGSSDDYDYDDDYDDEQEEDYGDDDERPKKRRGVACTASSSSTAVANRGSPGRKLAAAASATPRPPSRERDVAVGRKERLMAKTTTATPPNDDRNRKLPAKSRGNAVATKKIKDFWRKLTDDHAASSSQAVDSGSVEDDDDVKEAIRLSLEEKAERSKKNKESHDDMSEAIKLSLEDSKACTYTETEEMPPCRLLSPHEFKVAVDNFIHEQGGYEGIEGGQLIKHGNGNDMNKSCIANGGGRNQTGAEYGRYSIDGMFRVFDVLEGKSDIFVPEGKGAMEIKPGLGVSPRLDGLPGAKITAFVDIGHGMGIQVLQAGWSHGVPARGVEIMKGRHVVAEELMKGIIGNLCGDPPDSTAVVLKNVDFSHAIVLDSEGRRDEELRQFLLFAEPSIPMEVQKGLVIFINNAEQVFGPRSNQNAKGQDLDSFLARLFANMQVGGRIVTLTDISCNLTRSTDWFRRDVFESGPNAVSWGNQNKSVNVYVLTKLDDYWYCQNEKCQHKKLDNVPAKNAVVDKEGEPIERCVWCDERARPCPRLRKPAAAAAAEQLTAVKAQSRKNPGK